MSLKNGPWQVCFQNSNFEMKENNTNRCLEQQKLFSLSWKRIKKFTLINFFFVFIFRVYSWRMQSVSNITTEFWKEKKVCRLCVNIETSITQTFFCKMDFCCFNFFSIRLYVLLLSPPTSFLWNREIRLLDLSVLPTSLLCYLVINVFKHCSNLAYHFWDVFNFIITFKYILLKFLVWAICVL
jgi:hypothetical protein